MISEFNGIKYEIPEHEVTKLNEFIKTTWIPTIEKGIQTDDGTKRIPTSIKALSFSIFLKEYYRDNFEKYKITEVEGEPR